MYDIFYVSKTAGDDLNWKKIKLKYPLAQRVFNITSYDQLQSKSFTKMFWAIWEDTILNDTFDLKEFIVPSWDESYIHIFKNGDYYDGVCLFPKLANISQKEFRYRFFTNKKEIDIQASMPKLYNQYTPKSYNEYLDIKDDMFWVVWPEVQVTDFTVFDLYFSHHNSYDRRENHVFKNMFNTLETFASGIVLFSREKPISRREFDHRFLIEKKEHNVIVSKHRLYDVVFISYNESNAEENYKKLINKCARAKRVHGVEGIHQAHIKAAELCTSDMIWIVDGDAIVEDNFNFDLVMSSYDIDCVHVWRSRNPINGLEYGNGGIKLLPRKLTLEMDTNTSDMTTSISKKFKAMSSVSNVNAFNTDKFTTWRSAFRECCKLASRVIERQYEDETQQRLDIWCSVGADKPYGEYAIKGAMMGKQYGLDNKNNLEALRKINDFKWLKDTFNNVV